METRREVTHEIIRHIDVYDETKSWQGEVNLISWNGADPKIDIRRWNSDHSKMSKGLTLSVEEARFLGEILIRIPDDIAEIEE
jgi:hypothetical protein